MVDTVLVDDWENIGLPPECAGHLAYSKKDRNVKEAKKKAENFCGNFQDDKNSCELKTCKYFEIIKENNTIITNVILFFPSFIGY